MDPLNRNKWLLLVSSLGVLALLLVAVVQENVLREWRQIQAGVRTVTGPLPVQLRQIVNPALGVTDRCVSCHVAMAPGEERIVGTGVALHPRVVHDPAEFGCTICHGGQGRATERADAHGVTSFWPEPMLPVGMSEAGCGTCHIAFGVPRIEMLDAARQAFVRVGCVACHRVDGQGTRPDLGGMDGPDLSRVGIAGYPRDWYETHQGKAQSEASGPWRTAMKPVSETDRRSIELFLSTRVGTPGVIAGKSIFLSTGCLGCHRVSGVGGDDGPDLTHAGDKDPGRADFSAVPGPRTLVSWFGEHVRAPAAVVVGSQMPAPSASEAEVEALSLYTLSLRRRDVVGAYLPRDRMRVERFGEREFTSDGATLFGAFCSGCHGRNGEGHRVPGIAAFPSIANPDFLRRAPDELVLQTVLRGRPGRRMRAWGDGATGLRTEDAVAIVAYLRTLADAPAPVDPRPAHWVNGDRGRGERVFAATCAGCHGATGEGGEGPALNNPVLQEFATDTYLVETIASGRRGTAMGAYLEPSPSRQTLSRTEIEDVVTFIRSWGGRP